MYPNEKDDIYAAIDIVNQIKKGNFLNVMILRDSIPLIREARYFGGKRLIRGSNFFFLIL